jgi:DNA-binding NtrC family response regulator
VRTSPAMLEVQRLLERVAPQMTPVLILGETGTGKELVAREVHRLSPRRERPLKIVNCAALGEAQLESVLFGHAHGAFAGAERAQPGVFERARGGSVFLDEVGELSSAAQAALLRAIETGRVCPVGGNVDVDVDVRLISSTHRRLDDLVEQGLFRLDLFHRLNAFTVELSPLRDRLEEVGPLAEAFVRRFAPDAGSDGPVVSPETLQILERYAWPGNVRELQNVIERAVTLSEGNVLTPDDLPKHLVPCPETKGGSLVSPSRVPPLPAVGIDLRNELQQHEALLIVRALERTNGHQRKAAELLNLPLRTFERRLKDLGLNRPGMN